MRRPSSAKHLGERWLRVAVCIRSVPLRRPPLPAQIWAREHRPGGLEPLPPPQHDHRGVEIGDSVRIGPGLHINHGHVVIDGPVRIGPECSISPFVTIGLDTGGQLGGQTFGAPAMGRFVFIGTGAKSSAPSPSATTPASVRTPS
jgi:hypothetical protein